MTSDAEHLHILFHTAKHKMLLLPYFSILVAEDNWDYGQYWCYTFN